MSLPSEPTEYWITLGFTRVTVSPAEFRRIQRFGERYAKLERAYLDYVASIVAYRKAYPYRSRPPHPTKEHTDDA